MAGLNLARADPGIKNWADPLFCLMVSATWSSWSVDSGAFQWEDRPFNSQIEQQRSAYGVVAASKKERFCVRMFIMRSCHHCRVACGGPTLAGAPGLLSVNVNMALKAGQGTHYEFSDRGAQIVE